MSAFTCFECLKGFFSFNFLEISLTLFIILNKFESRELGEKTKKALFVFTYSEG